MKKLPFLLYFTFCIFDFAFAQNVGIGTTSPLAKLHVISSSGNPVVIDGGTSMYVTLSEAGTPRGYIGSFTGNPEDVDFGTFGSNITGKVHLTTGNVPRLTVINSGNVGIGTTNPEQLFSVAGGVVIDQTNLNNGTAATMLRFGSSSGEGIASKRTAGGNQNGLDFYTNNTGRMSITGSGNVGIGTLNPLTKLDVSGNISLNSNTLLLQGGTTLFYGLKYSATTDGPYLFGFSGGALGTFELPNTLTWDFIGNVAVRRDLLVDTMGSNNGSIDGSLRFGGWSGESIGSKRTAGGNQNGLDFYTSYVNRLSITQSGNVGIGVTNPGQQLTIANGMNIDESNSNNGTATNTLRFGSNSGEAIGSKRTAGGNQYGLDFYINFLPRMSITNAGNVGIGTTAPAVPLQFANAAGNKVSFFQNGSNHYGIGTQASLLQIFTPTSADDIAFGYGNSASFTENIRIDGSGSLSVKTDLTVQNGKGIIRNTASAQLKQVVTNVLVNGPSIGGLGTHSQNVTWSEAFSAAPVAAYAGNTTSGSGWAEVVVTIANVSSTGCTLYVFNPRNTTVNPTFNINLVAMGAQ